MGGCYQSTFGMQSLKATGYGNQFIDYIGIPQWIGESQC